MGGWYSASEGFETVVVIMTPRSETCAPSLSEGHGLSASTSEAN